MLPCWRPLWSRRSGTRPCERARIRTGSATIGDYTGRRHSPLTEINPRTVSRLAPKWVRQFPGTGDLETVPLVYQGVMYATIPNEVYALDAVTGREIWHYRAEGVGEAL